MRELQRGRLKTGFDFRAGAKSSTVGQIRNRCEFGRSSTRAGEPLPSKAAQLAPPTPQRPRDDRKHENERRREAETGESNRSAMPSAEISSA
jgi:hypothetical protein